MSVPSVPFRLLAPELILTATAIAVLLLSVAARRTRSALSLSLATLTASGSALALAAVLSLYVSMPPGEAGVRVTHVLVVDGLALFFKIVCILASIIAVMLTEAYHKRIRNIGEFYAILAFAELAMCLLVSARELITIYLALEFLSLVSYVMAGYMKDEPKSNEAAVKYFLYGASSAGVMLYGMSILYGISGSTDLGVIASHISGSSQPPYALVAAVSLVAVGFLFKIAAVPFHQWSPDIYEGAPTPVTAFLSVAPKTAGFGVLLRAFVEVFPTQAPDWPAVMAWLAALSMTVGNLSAIPQRNIKRMLAYSSIAQAGYVMMGVAVASDIMAGTGIPAALIYLAVYLVMNLGAFAVAIAVERLTGSEDIPEYAGLAQRAPWLAWTMVIFLISLAGLPLTAGFVGKFYLFAAVLRFHELFWLAVVAAVNTAISVYYYLNVARWMFFAPARTTAQVQQPISLRLTLVATLALTLALGAFPDRLVDMAASSVQIFRTAEGVHRSQSP
ncbi:MAG: NADH-quinone oxidoreductase subunit N [Armatimonadota bacterium]